MTEKIKIHYALQSCDVKNYQADVRFCTNNRTELSKKSITSFLQSVRYLANLEPNTVHCIRIFEDNCTEELQNYLNKLIDKHNVNNVQISIHSLGGVGIADSIKACYDWLLENGSNLVYQIQDDYLFTEKAVHLSVDMFYQIYQQYKTHSIICPYIDPDFMRNYKGRSIPRLIEMGKAGYWVQVYDTSCSFLTSHAQFIKHTDLYQTFYQLVKAKIIRNSLIDLENKSLNYIFTQRGVLGVTPINGLTFHMQTESERDPYIDWRPIWDSINIE